MADNFGLKIGVEGEREFKSALQEINQSFKVLGSEMNLVSSQFDKNDKSVQAITARNQVLNKEIDTQKDKISTLEKALANATDSFGENDKRTQAWAVQLNNAKAELNGMERELDQNNKALDKSADGFDEAEQGADKFGKEVKESGEQADDAGGRFEKLGGVLAGIGTALAAGVAAVGAAAVSAANSLKDMSVGAAAYADEILTASAVTGMSTESLQAYKYASELVDVSLETLTGSMAKQLKSMDAARDGNDKMKAAYASLGVSVTDVNGNLRDSETVYWEAIDALGQMSEGAERDALSMQIFGKTAQDLNPLIAQGSAGIAGLTEEAHRMGAVMSEEALDKLGSFDDTIQRFTAGTEAAKNALGMVLLPQLQALGTEGVDLLGNFTAGLLEADGDWTKISEVISETVSGFVTLLMESLPQIIQLAMDIVGAIGGAITENLPMIVEAASQIVMVLLEGLIAALPAITEGALQLVMSLVEGIIANLPALVEAALQMITTLATGIGESLPELVPAIVEAVVLIVQTLVENMDKILEGALQLITGLAEGLLAAIPVLIEALPDIILAIVDFLIESIPQIIETGIKLLTSLVEALPEIITAVVEAIPKIVDGIITAVIGAIPLIIDAGIKLLVSLIQNLPQIIVTVVKAIPQIVSSLVDAIIGNIDKIIMAGVQLFVALIENLPTIIIEIVKAVPQIIQGLIDAFGSLAWKIVQIGGDLIKGIWQGINDAGAWLRDKISGFFGGVVDSIKNFFGIKSPSTLFAGLGENMAQGLGIGFGDEMNKVGRDMQNAIPTDFNMDANISGGYSLDSVAGKSGNAAGSIVNQFHIAALVVREEADVDKIANALFRKQQQSRRGQGVVFA